MPFSFQVTSGGESPWVSLPDSCPEDWENEDEGDSFNPLSESREGLVEFGLPGDGLFAEPEGSFFEDEGSEQPSGIAVSSLGFKTLVLAESEAWVFSEEECLSVLEQDLGTIPIARRPMLGAKGRAVLLGLYGVGGFCGISRAASCNAEVTRYLNEFVRAQNPGHLWTTLYVSRNTWAPLHRDQRNAKGFFTLVRALGDFAGGGLWIEEEGKRGSVCKTLPDGCRKFGTVHDVHASSVVFSGEKWHGPEEWEGEVRWVISAFTPREIRKCTELHWAELSELGFPVEDVRQRVVDLDSVAGGLPAERACSLNDSRDVSDVEEVAWEVGLPVPVLDEVTREGWIKWHDSAARACRLWAEEFCDSLGPAEEVQDVAAQLRFVEGFAEWLEGCLEESLEGSLRALQVEVSLNPEANKPDMFLQTRTVGLAEARRELNCWKDPAQEEVTSLETTNRAVERVTSRTVEDWISQGISVVQLPGKAVLTRKSGTGKRRFRAVCCGNHLPTESLGLTKEEVYASGAESLSVKVAITFAARHKHWKGVTIDVKSAFLYAPIRSDAKGTDERIVVKPPYLLVELGLLGKEDRWWVRKALYGLPTSPRDWGRYRDAEFQKVRIAWQGREYCLCQTKSDDALWLLRAVDSNGMGSIEGVLVVYVDDLAMFAPEGLAKEFILAFAELNSHCFLLDTG